MRSGRSCIEKERVSYYNLRMNRNNKKVLFTIIGVVCIVLGILCVFYSELPVFLCGVGLLLYGIAQFFHWRERKKAGAAGFWAFLGMLLAWRQIHRILPER